MSLQRLARIQGHGIRVLDESYSEQLAEFEERGERIDPVSEIERARDLVWGRQRAATRCIRSSSAADGVTLPLT